MLLSSHDTSDRVSRVRGPARGLHRGRRHRHHRDQPRLRVPRDRGAGGRALARVWRQQPHLRQQLPGAVQRGGHLMPSISRYLPEIIKIEIDNLGIRNFFFN